MMEQGRDLITREVKSAFWRPDCSRVGGISVKREFSENVQVEKSGMKWGCGSWDGAARRSGGAMERTNDVNNSGAAVAPVTRRQRSKISPRKNLLATAAERTSTISAGRISTLQGQRKGENCAAPVAQVTCRGAPMHIQRAQAAPAAGAVVSLKGACGSAMDTFGERGEADVLPECTHVVGGPVRL